MSDQITSPDELDDSYDDQSPDHFTGFERQRIRKMLQDDDRATWLRRQVRILTPWIVAMAGGTYGLWNFLTQHWKSGP